MTTDSELSVDRCPVCGHRSTSRWSRTLGALIAGMIVTAVMLGLADVIVFAASHI